MSDPTVGPRRWVGLTLLPPLLPKELADFDTVVAIDARRRWLLTSKKRPGDTLLIDPTLPDVTPRLPVWTINAPNGAGRTDDGWPAVRHGEEALVLGRAGWRSEKRAVMRDQWAELPAIFDRSGRQYSVDGRTVHVADRDGLGGEAVVPGDSASEVRIAVDRGRLFAYSAEGSVYRYAITANSTGPKLTLEATFTAGVPTNADRIWIDPAGRLVMRGQDRLAIGFIDGRVPAALRDVMLRVNR